MPDMENVIKGLEGMIDYFFDIYRNDTDSYKCAKAQEYSDCAIDAIAMLKSQPQIVHCPGCVYKNTCISTENGIEQDGFCKWGKRKDGDGE